MIDNKKVSTYLLYAVGEVILVVIGILIAVEVNDWVENSKKKTMAESYKQSLIKDLQQDSLAIVSFLSNVELGQQSFDEFQSRLTATGANLDTAVYIARYEISLLTDRISPFNTNTFSALTSTGDINLLSKTIINLLFELQRNQQLSLELTDLTYKEFWSSASEFSYQLPGNVDFLLINKGPINDHLWETTDKETIAALLHKTISARQNHYRISKLLILDIQQKTHELIEKLRETE